MAFLEQELGKLLREKHLTLGVIESATGGLISRLITSVPGCSDYYKGSITAYANQTKINVVGVKADTIVKYGAVSHQVAEEMAAGGAKVLDVDLCISDTGIAGPGGGSPDKPVGLFYLGLAYHDSVLSCKHNFKGTREQNINAAAEAALILLKEHLAKLE